MEFKRINSGTVRCIVEQEDLAEYDIKLEDFFKNSDNMHEFLHMIVERAVEEVGYEPKDMNTLSMQIMPLPKNRLAITLTDSGLSSFYELMENIKDTLTDEDSNIAAQIGRIEKSMNSRAKGLAVKREDVCVAVFENFTKLSGYAGTLGVVSGLASSLFYDSSTREYMLVLKKSRATKENFEKAVSIVPEYGIVISEREVTIESVKEHCQCIVGSGALELVNTLS